jgi:hypothetical protein
MQIRNPNKVGTPIVDKPSYATLQLLRQELYANARAITSILGGGENGQLFLIMPAAEFNARPLADLFVHPVHPGASPPAGVTGVAAIAESIRQYKADIELHHKCVTVEEELKKQLLAAIHNRYISILSNKIMGLLAHLLGTYGRVTAADLEANRTTLYEPWNPKDDIENLWCRIKDAQDFATDNQGDPISDATAIEATLRAFEKAAVYHDQVMAWRNQDKTAATLATFQEHFDIADTECNRQATAQTAGFHGAHAAATTSPPADDPDAKYCHTVYYCSSHGFSKNPKHTSRLCTDKQTDHDDNDDGANIRIAARRPRPRS